MSNQQAITVDQAQVDSVIRLLKGVQRDANKALSRSLRRTAIGAKALIARELKNTVTLKVARIKQDINLDNATVKRLRAVITLKESLITGINFTNRKLKKGISIKKWKSKGPQKFAHAFYANMPAGKKHPARRGIFMRAEVSPNIYAGRIPTIELYGPPITLVYEKTPGLSNKVETESADRLQRELNSQINFILNRYNDG